MGSFKLIEGVRSTLRPEKANLLAIDASGKIIFPTKWLIYQINLNNITVDDVQAFGNSTTRGKLLLIQILTSREDFKDYDFVVMDTNDSDYVVSCYRLPDNYGVKPYLNQSKTLPIISSFNGINTPNFYLHASTFNSNMEAYFVNCNLMLRDVLLYEKGDNVQKDDGAIQKALELWTYNSVQYVRKKRRERVKAKAKEKANSVPQFVLDAMNQPDSDDDDFF